MTLREALDAEIQAHEKTKAALKEAQSGSAVTWNEASRHSLNRMCELYQESKQEVREAQAQAARYRAALERLLSRYCRLVNSGDCGFWNPEEEDEVKAARAVLEELRSEPTVEPPTNVDNSLP